MFLPESRATRRLSGSEKGFPRPRTGLLNVLLCLSLLPLSVLTHAQAPKPNGLELRIIVVDSSSQADRAVQRLKSGEEFTAIAKEISIDPTASDGGYMGVVDPTTLRSELRDALKGVAAGQMTGVILLPSGYAILKVLVPAETAALQNTSPARILPSAATGAIRYAPNVGGKGEADLAFRNFPKADGWNQNLQTMCDVRQQSLAGVISDVEKTLDPANPDGLAQHGKPLDLVQMHYALANLYAFKGEMAKSIAQWQEAYEIASAQLPAAMPELEEVLGIAYLHHAEMENDIYRHPTEQCIFPPPVNRSFAKRESSEKAVEYLLKYLQRKPDALDIRWVLNLAYMTLGKYPAGVPAQYLIPPSTFESPEDVPHFVDVAPAAGLNLFSMSGGLIVDDFERNGLYDVVTSDFGQCAPMHFFHNNGDGTFTDRTAQAGLSDQLGGLNLIQTDYNNDGCLDITVLRGAWELPQRMSLLRNNCDGTFTDVTKAAGLDLPVQTQTAVWADIDNDGYLDLFVGNENGPSHLFRNKGDGTFEDISHAAGGEL